MFRSSGRSGKQRKRITVTTNDPETPKLFLSLEGTVMTEVMFEPRSLAFGQVTRGESAEKEFTVTLSKPDKAKIVGVTVDSDQFAVRQLEDDKSGTLKYALRFKGSNKVARTSAQVSVELKGASVDKVEIPARVQVVGDLRYARSIYFIKRQERFSDRDVTFTSRSGKNVKITGLEDPKGYLELSVVDNEKPTAKIRARVKNQEESYLMPKREKFIVRTDVEDEPEIEISYTIAERRQPRGPGLIKNQPFGAPPRNLPKSE